jgi:HSP20 family molecular chaperone IbpA
MTNEMTQRTPNEMTVKQEIGSRHEHTRAGRTYAPNVEIRETEDAIWLWADLPGVDEESVDVNVDGGMLSVRADVKADDYADLTPVYTEYNVGRFERRFRLSTEVDPDHIEARLRDGVLELQLPKAEEARPRRIPIESG